MICIGSKPFGTAVNRRLEGTASIAALCDPKGGALHTHNQGNKGQRLCIVRQLAGHDESGEARRSEPSHGFMSTAKLTPG